MSDPWEAVAAVRGHPALADVGRDGLEQAQAEQLAHDVAAWLVGAAWARLGALGRVVVLLGGPELRTARALARDLPWVAVEAAARLVAFLWPWLRPPETDRSLAPEGAEEVVAPEPEPARAAAGADGTAPVAGDDTAPDEVAEGDPTGARAAVEALAGGLAAEEHGAVDALVRALAADGDAVRDAALAGAARATDAAEEVAAVARDLARLLPGFGHGAGALQRVVLRDLEAAAALLAARADLRAVAEALGREEAAAARARHADGGGEAVTGLRMGVPPARALPAELALLGDAATEDLFFAKVVERRLLGVALAGAGAEGEGRPERRGPVVVALDMSGSMVGDPERLAKAVVLAVCRRVLPRGRRVVVVGFGARGELTEAALVPGGSPEPLLRLLATRFGGGTDFDHALARALDVAEATEGADVLLVTDGLGRVAPALAARARALAGSGGPRVRVALVGLDRGEALAGVTDVVWHLGRGEAGPSWR